MSIKTKVQIDKGRYNEIKHDYPMNFFIFMHLLFIQHIHWIPLVSDSEDMIVNKIEWPPFVLFEFTIYTYHWFFRNNTSIYRKILIFLHVRRSGQT